MQMMLDFAAEWFIANHTTQRELAAKLHINHATVSMVLSGHSKAGVDTAERILNAVGMSVPEFAKRFPDTPLAEKFRMAGMVPPYDVEEELEKWLSPERYGVDLYMCDGKEPRRVWI